MKKSVKKLLITCLTVFAFGVGLSMIKSADINSVSATEETNVIHVVLDPTEAVTYTGSKPADGYVLDSGTPNSLLIQEASILNSGGAPEGTYLIQLNFIDSNEGNTDSYIRFTVQKGVTYDSLSYSFDGNNYTKISSYDYFYEEEGFDCFKLDNITEGIYLRPNFNCIKTTFAANEQSYIDTTIVQIPGETYILPTKSPIKMGYNFVGWFTEEEGGSKITSETIVDLDASTTFYAHYTPINYTVNFDANGGTWPEEVTVKTLTIAYDSNFIFPDSNPTKFGFQFTGWYSKVLKTIVTTDSIFKGDNKLTAQWSECSHIGSLQIHDGIEPGCTNGGQKPYYECSCGKLFTDSKGINEIVDLQTWLNSADGGYIGALGHDKVITYIWNEDYSACKGIIECSKGDYLEEEQATVVIENGFAIATFESNTFVKQIVELPKEDKLSGGEIAGIVIGSTCGLALVAYISMFFVWKKNEKALKFLKPSYKWLNTKIFKK